MKIFLKLLIIFFISNVYANDWQLGPFKRINTNPILKPCKKSKFYCPVQKKEIFGESKHLFNPGATFYNGKICLIYRAEDDYGEGIGMHTSRLGFAQSSDGINFERNKNPILYPSIDDQNIYEFPGGCEDPRIVKREDGTYIMTYTQWNRQVAVLAIASSKDLVKWKKHGYAFEGKIYRRWSKAGSIVCREENGNLIATKINGKYWMYWGEGIIYAATSDDLISWEPVIDDDKYLVEVLKPRHGKFDSLLVEAGPPAIITSKGILLLYNGKNSIIKEKMDKEILPWAYSAGQVLFDISSPTEIKKRSKNCFLTPKTSFEKTGQYKGGTVFIQGLIPFKKKWYLYYGTADSAIAVAICTYNKN